uniref:Phagocyte signaling-impaired protein n=1 Tax=Rhizophora mucronata TaxID=61149 RepID=A0A2P2M6U4_RHIMU
MRIVDQSTSTLLCSFLTMAVFVKQQCTFSIDYKIIRIICFCFQYRFGHLACFTSDVEMFLQVLTPDKKMDFLEKLIESINTKTTELTKVLGQSTTIFKMRELIGDVYKLPVFELEHSAIKMVETYCETLPLSKDLDPQESMHGEELLSMVCNVLVQLFCCTRHLGYLMEAIMVLEFGLTIRQYVWQYKILLVHLYSHLGVISLACEWYKSLDVKNIMLETMTHHILPQLAISPLWVDLSNLLKDYLRFMDDHFRESADLSFLAYRHRNYSKVIEFVQFKERLQRSNHYLLAKVEKSILQLKQKADNIEEEEGVLEDLNHGIHCVELTNEIGSKTLTFNEDLHSRPWWTPTPEKNYLLGPFEGISYCPKENLIKEREVNIRRVVERKSLLPRLVYLSIQSTPSIKKSVGVNGSASETKISKEFKFLLERYVEMLGSSFRDAIELVKGVSSGLKSAEGFGSDIIDWMNFAVFLNAWNLNSHELSQPDGGGLWQALDALLEKHILEKTRSIGSLVCSPSDSFSSLVQLITEPLAWHLLVIQSHVRFCLPSGKKKKKGGLAEQSTPLLSNAARDSIHSLCGMVEEVANWIREQISRPEDEIVDATLSSFRRNEHDEGPGKVFQILERLLSQIDKDELGDRICQALKSWNPVDVSRKIAIGNSMVLSEFLCICESKMKSLRALKQQIAQA